MTRTRPIVEACASAAVAFAAALAFERGLVRLLGVDLLELEWISDVVLAAAFGAATFLWLHLRLARTALTRLEQLVQEAVVTVPRALIADAIDLIVFIKGRGSERRIESILQLAGLDEDGAYVLTPAAAPALHVVS